MQISHLYYALLFISFETAISGQIFFRICRSAVRVGRKRKFIPTELSICESQMESRKSDFIWGFQSRFYPVDFTC